MMTQAPSEQETDVLLFWKPWLMMIHLPIMILQALALHWWRLYQMITLLNLGAIISYF